MNTLLSFNSEQTDCQNYYWWQNIFNKPELDMIEKYIEDIPFQRATTIGSDAVNREADKKIRSSNIKWLPHTENFIWLYDKFSDMIVTANNVLWKFNLHSIIDNIQYTVYNSEEEGHYGMHQDIGTGTASLRKVSFVVQLSDPSEYEGGDLQIISGEHSIQTIPKGLGNAVAFPSYMPHRVTPVTKGIRKSLVLWAGGEHYK